MPAVGWPFGVFLIEQFSETIPSEILEAAKIDGCSELKTLTRIVVPMAGATLAALPILIVFFAFQKYFTQGITIGSVKG